jgi:hypothetical protein
VSVPHHVEETARGGRYEVVPDRTNVYRVLVTGSVTDAVTGEPIPTFAVHVKERGLQAKTVDGGLFCIAGNPEQVFPKLDLHAYAIDLVIAADAYGSSPLTVPVPLQASFPILLPPLELEPLPVRIAGRVVKSELDRDRSPGAEVSCAGTPGAGVPGHVLGLASPVAFAHAVGTVVRERDVAAGVASTLEHDAATGSAEITLHDLTNIAPQDLLCLDPDATRLYVEVDPGWAPPANPAQPGVVELTAELYRGFPAGTPVAQATPGTIGTVTHVARAAQPGHGAVVVDDVLGAESVEFVDATRHEYRSARAIADASGFYAFDGITSAHVMELSARAAGAAATGPPVSWTVAYGEPVNVVNLRAS